MIRIMLKRLQIPRHESKLRGWALNSVRRHCSRPCTCSGLPLLIITCILFRASFQSHCDVGVLTDVVPGGLEKR